MSLTKNDLEVKIGQISSASFKNEAERAGARLVLQKALARVETPWEKATDVIWSQPALNACLKVGVDTGLFKKWKAAGASSMSSKELAGLVHCDPELIGRLLKHMASMCSVNEISEDTYAMTPWTRSLADPELSGAISYLFDVNWPGFHKLPTHLQQHQYKTPQDPTQTAWKAASPSNLGIFEFFAKYPEKAQNFSNAMKAHSMGQTSWVQLYPTETLMASPKLDRPIVVDVGGSHGFDLESLCSKHPEMPSGSLVLQDLPNVIEHARVGGAIRTMGHDFFHPQPIKGARAYYMHIVLHDWNDEKAVQILRNLASAMEPGYSKVLIHDTIISSFASHPYPTTADILMMMLFSGCERNEAKWRELVKSAGLKVVHIWSSAESIHSIIEAELA